MTENNGDESSQYVYDRLKEVEAFDRTKLGVKGLVDSGITQIPSIFVHPPESLPLAAETFHFDSADDHDLIPVIDLLCPHSSLVKQVHDASAGPGFFQVINHGIPLSLPDRLIDAIRAFHELPGEEKVQFYGKDTMATTAGVGFRSNYDLYTAKAASWRDTLEVRLGPTPLDPAAIPDVCRGEVLEWGKEVKELAGRLMGLLSEGLGLSTDKMKGIDYLGRINMGGQYYPYCPEPNKTIGIVSHTDPGILTVLLQDQVGGLQVKHHGKWLNLKPVHGALVINIGDLLQILSNDEYISGEHRVIPHPEGKSRVSVATFFSSGVYDNMYGPLPELVSLEKPALYAQFQFSDYIARFITKELVGKSMANHFRLS